MDLDLSSLAEGVLKNFKEMAGSFWDKLTEEDLNVLEKLAVEAAQLHIDALGGKENSQEIAIVTARAANIAVSRYFDVRRTFWYAFEKTCAEALAAMIRIAIAAVKA